MKNNITKFVAAATIVFSVFLISCGEEEPEKIETAPPSETESQTGMEVNESVTKQEEEIKEQDTGSDEIPDKYEVTYGETLASIAYKYYGDSTKWFDIFINNERKINNWNHIHPGQHLDLPDLKMKDANE